MEKLTRERVGAGLAGHYADTKAGGLGLATVARRFKVIVKGYAIVRNGSDGDGGRKEKRIECGMWRRWRMCRTWMENVQDVQYMPLSIEPLRYKSKSPHDSSRMLEAKERRGVSVLCER